MSGQADVVLYLFTTLNDVPMMVGKTGQGTQGDGSIVLRICYVFLA